jgi:hypothetical protein
MLIIGNVGQFAPGARFLVRGGPGTLWLAEDAIWLTVMEPSAFSPQPSAGRFPLSQGEEEPLKGVNLKLTFVGANPQARLEPLERLETKVSYFLGADPARWHAEVPVWGGVRYVDLYPGIDLVIGDVGAGSKPAPTQGLAWRLVVREGDHAGSPLQNVQLCIEGAEGVVVEGGALRLTTAVGDLVLPLLTAEGSGVGEQGSGLTPNPQPLAAGVFEVAAPFAPAEGPAGGDVSTSPLGATDLRFSTFLGGSASEEGYAVAVDGAGAAYVTGSTASANFPTTPGAFDRVRGGTDAFVAKLNPSGSALVYATFLGGNGDEELDRGLGIAVDGAGNAYVTGETHSSTFPTTSGAFDRTFNDGLTDAFVAKLNPSGSALLYATYLGGSMGDGGYSIAVDGRGDAYVAGYTGSGNFPTTSGAYDQHHHSLNDGFVAKLNAAGSALVYATYLGGNGGDAANGVALDGAGFAYVTGSTASTDLPAPTTDFHGGASDAFVAKLNPLGSFLGYCFYLGGSGTDQGQAIAVDGTGAAYVAGQTDSGTFPTTPGAYDGHYNGGIDVFVTRLNPTGTALIYSTFLGSSDSDWAWGIALDGSGAACVAGQTNSNTFPTTPGAYDTTFNDPGSPLGDAFVAKLNAAGSALVYSTFLGGSKRDFANKVAMDGSGAAYVVGDTESGGNFPITSGAYNRIFNGVQDAFVAKLALPGGGVTFGPAAPWRSGYGPSAGGWTSQERYPRFVADVSGDGKADVVGFGDAGVFVSLSTGTSFGAQSVWSNSFGVSPSAGSWTSQNTYPRTLADVNGDGKADVIGFGRYGTYVSLSTGTAFAAPTRWIANFGLSAGGWTSQDSCPRFAADVNGDGKADIVGFGRYGVYVSLSTGTAFAPATRWIANYGASAGGWTSQNTYPRFVADVNHDHKADVVGFGSGGAYVSLSTGGSFSPPMLWIGTYGTSASAGGWTNENTYPRTLADVNGDGQYDVVGFGLSGAFGSFSTGAVFRSADQGIALYGTSAAAGSWTSQNTYPRWAADANGDGKADVVGFGNTGVFVSLSQ